MNCIAHFSDLREHHRGSGTHEKIGRIPNRRVGSYTRECITPPALQADDEVRGGANLSSSRVELHQTLFGHLHNGMDHIAKSAMLVVLKPNNIGSRREDWQCIAGKQLGRLQLLAT